MRRNSVVASTMRNFSQCAPNLSISPNIKHSIRNFFMWPIAYSKSLGRVFGMKLIIYLFVAQHILKGFVQTMTNSTQSWLLAEKNVVGPRLQVLAAVTGLPWAMKPIIGNKIQNETVVVCAN